MNAVLFFSCTGESKKVAEKLASKLNWPCRDMLGGAYEQLPDKAHDRAQKENSDAETNAMRHKTVAIVFPVHCQGVPAALKGLLGKIRAEYAALIATYGRMSPGNAVCEAAQLIDAKICAAAYIPSAHSYIKGDDFHSPDVPEIITEKLLSPTPIVLPKRKKAPFAGFLPELRSRLTVKISRSDKCDNCGICTLVCPLNAMHCGKPDAHCARCLKCVRECPRGALEAETSPIVKIYLSKKKKEEIIVYA